MEDVIHLNVGGKLYTTTLKTLTNTKDPNFFTALLNPNNPAVKDKDGNYFVDRDGKIFEIILKFLRTGVLKLPENTDWPSLKNEADFYLIDLPDKNKFSVKLTGAYISQYDWKEMFIFDETTCIVCKGEDIKVHKWSHCEQFISVSKHFSGVVTASGDILCMTMMESLSKEGINYIFHESKRPKFNVAYIKTHGALDFQSICFKEDSCLIFMERRKLFAGSTIKEMDIPVLWDEDNNFHLYKAYLDLQEHEKSYYKVEAIFFGEWMYLIVNEANLLIFYIK